MPEERWTLWPNGTFSGPEFWRGDEFPGPETINVVWEKDHEALQSKLKEQEERCEKLEEALRRLQMGPDTLTQAGLRIVLDALYPEARTALQGGAGDGSSD